MKSPVASKTDSEWSFSCRTTPYATYADSDCDTTDSESDHAKISSETQQIIDLDLSSRVETVQYRPNPFSIAKINAAMRAKPTTTKPTPGITPGAASNLNRVRGKAEDNAKPVRSKLQGNIVDGFKKQAQRSRANEAVVRANTKIQDPKLHPPLKANTKTLVTPRTSKPFQTLVLPSVTPPTPLLRSSGKAQAKKNVTISCEDVSCGFSAEPMPENTRKDARIPNLSSNYAHISYPTLPMLHDIPLVEPRVISNVNYCSRDDSPNRFDTQLTISRTSYRAHEFPFSSPLPESRFTYSDLPAAMSSPVQPSHLISPPPFKSRYRTSGPPNGRKQLTADPFSPAFAYRAPPSQPRSPWTRPMPISSPLASPSVQHISPRRQRQGAKDSSIIQPLKTPNQNPSRPADSISNSKVEPLMAPQLCYENQIDTLEPASIEYYHAPQRKRSISPSPSPHPVIRTYAPPAKKMDAYAFSADPEEDWSTLPARKKPKTMTGVQRTSKFRIPKLLGSAGKSTAIVKSGIPATSARRVITFLPPPLHPKPKTMPVSVPAEAYPSPTRSALRSSSPAPEDTSDPSQAQPDEQRHHESYIPLSPPASDPPVPHMQTPRRGSKRDLCAAVDLDAIASEYPGAKAAWREVR
ncbi:hypothetical protein H0H81_011641 [Sphagnurus paluster]|uniref:Uncharacterized protein n=1 Tax=Sphagnurus paluster TaxID=117069 RepID=A0A9P7GJ08_9AGAR|nr:hypothetical protein H0H81_011641 [Sphagnurus paluster]